MSYIALVLLAGAPTVLGIATLGISSLGTASTAARRLLAHALALAGLGCVFAGVIRVRPDQPLTIADTSLALDQVGRLEIGFLAIYGALVLGYHYLAGRDSPLPAILPAVVATVVAGHVFGPQLLVAASFFLLACLLTSLLMIAELSDWSASVAGVTYLILSALGGMALLFGFVLASIQRLSPGGLVTIPFVVAVLSVGLALLLGVAPLHFSVPNTLHRAGPVSAALALGLLGPATVGLLLQALSALPQLVVDERVNGYLRTGGLFSAVFGAIAALAPAGLRRRLGYAFVADAGFVVVGIVTYTRLGVAGALLHLAHRSLIALVLAGAAAEFEGTERDPQKCGAPYLWVTLLLGALSLVALPPLSGFAAAWAIYQAVSLADWRVAALLALTSVTCLGGLLAALGGVRRGYARPWRAPRLVELWLMLLAAATALWGLAPGPYLDALYRAVAQLAFVRPV